MKRGFTLVEYMIIVAILAIIISVIGGAIQNGKIQNKVKEGIPLTKQETETITLPPKDYLEISTFKNGSFGRTRFYEVEYNGVKYLTNGYCIIKLEQ